MSASAEHTINTDAGARRLKMGLLMAALTLGMLIAWFLAPISLKLALIFVGMTTAVYSAFNLIMYRYWRKTTAA